MVKALLSAGLAALVAVLVIAGCGGGGDEATASLPRAQFLKQGNAICKRGEEERSKVLEKAFQQYKPGQKPTKSQKEDLIFTALVPQYKKMIAGLRELGAPAGDEKQVEAIIDAMEATNKHVEGDPLEAFRTVKPFAKPNKLNEEYGLTSCII